MDQQWCFFLAARPSSAVYLLTLICQPNGTMIGMIRGDPYVPVCFYVTPPKSVPAAEDAVACNDPWMRDVRPRRCINVD